MRLTNAERDLLQAVARNYAALVVLELGADKLRAELNVQLRAELNMSRTDAHRPSAINPADYVAPEVVKIFDGIIDGAFALALPPDESATTWPAPAARTRPRPRGSRRPSGGPAAYSRASSITLRNRFTSKAFTEPQTMQLPPCSCCLNEAWTIFNAQRPAKARERDRQR